MPQTCQTTKKVDIAFVRPTEVYFYKEIDVEKMVRELSEEGLLELLLESIEHSIEICKKDSLTKVSLKCMEFVFPGLAEEDEKTLENAIKINKEALAVIKSEMLKKQSS